MRYSHQAAQGGARTTSSPEKQVAKAVLDALIVKNQGAGALDRVKQPAAKAKKRAKREPMPKSKTAALVPAERITDSILILRGLKVLLDADLAALYGVATKVLLQAVKRNLERFPDDFMVQLTATEWAALRSQFVTSKAERGGRRYAPYAFTEQGVAMLSSVLKSSRAITVNIEIMRAFVRMRELLASNKELAQQLVELERKVSTHDQAITGILKAIRELMSPPEAKKRPIGFVYPEEKK